jgi:hypothetical protein
VVVELDICKFGARLGMGTSSPMLEWMRAFKGLLHA